MMKLITTATVMHTTFTGSILNGEQSPLSAQINVSILGLVSSFKLNTDTCVADISKVLDMKNHEGISAFFEKFLQKKGQANGSLNSHDEWTLA